MTEETRKEDISYTDQDMKQDIDTINQNWDLAPTQIPLGFPLIQMRARILGQALSQQTTQNFALTRLVNQTYNLIRLHTDQLASHDDHLEKLAVSLREGIRGNDERLAEAVEKLSETMEKNANTQEQDRDVLEEGIRMVWKTMEENAKALERNEDTLQENTVELTRYFRKVDFLLQKVESLDRKMNTFLDNLSTVQPENLEQVRQDMVDELTSGFDYIAFENRFRGDMAVIKERQSVYVPYFKECKRVLDVGCGRGEFLELLKGANIPAMGIDLSFSMASCAKEKGLDVRQMDAIAFLSECRDGEFDGVFISQLVEHLTFKELVALLQLCKKKMKSKGVLIIETINPHCQRALEMFNLDPTHNKPIFPETLEHLLEGLMFRRETIEFISPLPDVQEPAPGENKRAEDYCDYGIVFIKES